MAGRKPKKPADKKSHRVRVAFCEWQFDLLLRAAEIEGMSVTQWISKRCLLLAGKELDDAYAALLEPLPEPTVGK